MSVPSVTRVLLDNMTAYVTKQSTRRRSFIFVDKSHSLYPASPGDVGEDLREQIVWSFTGVQSLGESV